MIQLQRCRRGHPGTLTVSPLVPSRQVQKQFRERKKNPNFKGPIECVEMPWLNREANQAQRRRSRSQPGWKAQLGSEAPKLRAWQHGSSPSHPIEVVPTAARSHELIRCICISLEGLAKHQSADLMRCGAMRCGERSKHLQQRIPRAAPAAGPWALEQTIRQACLFYPISEAEKGRRGAPSEARRQPRQSQIEPSRIRAALAVAPPRCLHPRSSVESRWASSKLSAGQSSEAHAVAPSRPMGSTLPALRLKVYGLSWLAAPPRPGSTMQV